MPLKLSIGLSRKVGEANYGSRGDTVGLELEADATLVQRPDEFFRQVSESFRLARESVDRELGRSPASCDGDAAHNGTAQQVRQLRNATPNQLRALHRIAADQGRDLVAEARDRYGVDRPRELSLVEASELIDALRGVPGSPTMDSEAAEPAARSEC